jgi:hypothetical protein
MNCLSITPSHGEAQNHGGEPWREIADVPMTDFNPNPVYMLLQMRWARDGTLTGARGNWRAQPWCGGGFMRSPNSNELCTVPRYTEMMPKATIDSQWTGDPQSHALGPNNRPADVRSATVCHTRISGAPRPGREHNHQVCWDQVSHIWWIMAQDRMSQLYYIIEVLYK